MYLNLFVSDKNENRYIVISIIKKKKKKSGVVEIGYCLNRIAQNLRSEVSSFFRISNISLLYKNHYEREKNQP